MGNDASLISRIKAQITRYSSRLSDDLGKVKSRFGAHPICLLTNIPLLRRDEHAACEATLRFATPMRSFMPSHTS